ncbi:MAG: hypothetical protein HYX94_11720 [Chloroflexi bacterium]|nr:hypothetical protein [Chloroflexota bacterium]
MIKPLAIRIDPSTVYRVERHLPTEGDIIVSVGDAVQAATPIARVLLPAPPANVPVAATLDVRPRDLVVYLVRQVGEQVKANGVIGRRRASVWQSKRECVSPIDGTVESVDYELGHVTIRRSQKPTAIWAEAVGRVTEVIPRRAVVIQTSAAVIQGSLGLGEEVFGLLKVIGDRPDDLISVDDLDRSCLGCILAGGGIENDEVLVTAEVVGVKGLILGGVRAVGHERWPVLGGSISPTIVLTGGFGEAGIFPPAFEVLLRNQGKQVWLRPGGPNQEAGRVRAEVVVMHSDEPPGNVHPSAEAPALAVGARARVARPPHLGLDCRIAALPRLPRELESGLRALVAEVETDDGRRVTVPLVNLELTG